MPQVCTSVHPRRYPTSPAFLSAFPLSPFLSSSSPLSVLQHHGTCDRVGRLFVCVATSTHDAVRFDAIVIGSGLGGLSAGALLAAAGRKVCVLEAHTAIGGAAHSFTRRTAAGKFKFESGPHLLSGLSPSQTSSHNPMRDVLLATGAASELEIRRYASWGVFIGDSAEPIESAILRSRPFLDSLLSNAGERDVERLLKEVLPLGDVATTIGPSWLRSGDIFGSLRVALPRMTRMLPVLINAGVGVTALLQPFEKLLRKNVKDQFAFNFINLICFLLAGVQADRIPTAEVAYMLREWVPPESSKSNITPGSPDDCVLEHVVGGVSALANALANVIRGHEGCEVRTNARVGEIIVEDGTAVGVQLVSGQSVYGNDVVCNASLFDLSGLLPDPWKTMVDMEVSKIEMCPSFMHVHVAVRRSAVGTERLLPNYAVVRDFRQSIETAGNVTLVSVPSVVDAGVCAEEYVVAHAYGPATEPWDIWKDVAPGSQEYETLKRERAKPVWDALKQVFGNERLEEDAELAMVATPHTHARFINRRNGSYGPRVNAAAKGLGIGIPLPGSLDLPRRLHTVGDGTFPGIGVPAVAGSAWITVNAMLSVEEQEKLLARTEQDSF